MNVSTRFIAHGMEIQQHLRYKLNFYVYYGGVVYGGYVLSFIRDSASLLLHSHVWN